MGFRDWLFFHGLGGRKAFELTDSLYPLTVETIYREAALESCISLLAGVVAGCEVQTYEKGERVKKSNYYLFNVRPNQNQSAGAFFHALVSKLIRENEALAVMENEKLYLADSFTVEEFALRAHIYKNVTIGNFTYTGKVFTSKDVFHFKLNDVNIAALVRALHSSYGKLLSAAQSI